MSRYVCIHIRETDDGGVHINATGLPRSTSVTYSELAPTQQLAAQLMVHAEKLLGRARETLEETPDEATGRQVA